ncbi:hypothetical protein Ac2012v2_003068 [Leucoagaricus gongylophorus]
MSYREVHTPATVAIQDDGSQDKAICKLCHRQFAKYTCPSCNVPYCSLVCFRSSSHSQCSETFYKNELQSDIATTPSRTHEERKQMMELLRRFEEEAVQDEDIVDKEASEISNEGIGGEDSLVDRFAELDIDSLSPETMWEMLTPAERRKFVKALENPSSELAQTLLASKQLEVEIEQPWWINGVEDFDREHLSQEAKEIERRPTPICVPQSMVKPVPPGHPLVFNLLAICITYSYVVRHLGTRMLSALAPTNPNFQEALRLINILVPFLTDYRSTTLHSSVGAAVTDVYSRFEMGKVSSQLLAVLLMDAAILMRPLRIVPVSSVPPQSGETTSFVDLSAHSLLMPTHVLSDMIVLFQTGQEEAKKVSLEAPSPSALGQPRSRSGTGSETRKKLSRYNHVLHKLEFYVAHVLAIPSGIMENVSDAVLNWSRRVQAEC